jgi:hypothetical protein
MDLEMPFIRKLTDFNIFNEQFRQKIFNNKNRLTMAELKTTQNDADVIECVNSFADTEQKRKDSFELIKLMRDFTGFEPKMWGPSIIGFGSYHYRSERSRQEGDWPLVGFSQGKRLFHFMYIQEQKNMSIFWMG